MSTRIINYPSRNQPMRTQSNMQDWPENGPRVVSAVYNEEAASWPQPPIDMQKQYRYRHLPKRTCRVLCIDGPQEKQPVVTIDDQGEVHQHGKYGNYEYFDTSTGKAPKHSLDLIEVEEVWTMNVWESKTTGVIYLIPSTTEECIETRLMVVPAGYDLLQPVYPEA